MPSAVLLGYDLDQPSFRHRMRTLVGVLEAAGWQVRAERFPSRRYGLRTWERRSLNAEPRSAYLLSGPARNKWEHSIPPLEARRYSITFRTLRENVPRRA